MLAYQEGDTREKQDKVNMHKYSYSLSLFVVLSQLTLLPYTAATNQPNVPLKLTSPVFHDKGKIPRQYTRDGQDISPPLMWKIVPQGTESLALICEDPNAPHSNWIHWVLYNIPSHLRQIEEGGKNLPQSVLVGKNSWNVISYNGPNPPYGIHHYIFTLYALDTVLQLAKGVTSTELRQAMQGHILAESTLTGLYSAK